MARPQKEGLDYFPHDTDASTDEKIESLRLLYGNDGYAFYFILLERIYRTKNVEIDISDAETIQILSRKIGIDEQKFHSILNSALKVGCFSREAYEKRKVLTSDGVMKRAAMVLEKRRKSRREYTPKAKDEDRVSDAETREETRPETPQTKLNKTKLNKKEVVVVEGSQVSDVYKFFQSNIGLVSPFQSEVISQYLDDGLQPDLIIAVMEDSLGKDDKWSWIKTVLQASLEKNIRTVEQYEAMKTERKNRKGGNSGGNKGRNSGDDSEPIEGVGITL